MSQFNTSCLNLRKTFIKRLKNVHHGGAKRGWRGGGKMGQCPGCKRLCHGFFMAGKPSSFHSVCLLNNVVGAHSTQGEILKANFLKLSPGVTPPDPLLRRGVYPIPDPLTSARPTTVSRAQAPQCSVPDHRGKTVLYWCPGKN